MGIPVYCVLVLVLYNIGFSTCTSVCTNKVGIKCDCTYSNTGKLTVDCSQKSLTSVPDGIQQDATVADFTGNSITSIELNDFDGLDSLEKLYLNQNLISSIAVGAFDKLIKLQRLNIKRNNLTAIESGHFHHLPSLNALFLQRNSISRIAAGAFDTLFKLDTLGLQWNKMTAIDSGHFHHLPSLISLDLSYNKITSFARDSILYLPKLGQLAINENPLRCDCEMRAFRQSINARQGNLLVISAKCEGTNIKMTNAAEILFGNCQGDDLFRTVTCNNCKNARSTEDCIAQDSKINCTVQQFTNPVCQEEITYVPSSLIINKGCNHYYPTMDAERNNADQCYGTSTVRCTFCCIGQHCNNRELRGRVHSSIYMVTVQLGGSIPSSLSDPSSPIYTNFVVAVQSQLDNELTNKPTSNGSFITTLRYVGPPNFTIRLRIEYSTVSEVDSKAKGTYIRNKLNALVYIYTADYPVLDVQVNLMDAGCPSEATQTDKGQFKWPFVNPGESASVPCPVPKTTGAKATRPCFTNSSGSAVWGVTDTSSCLTASSVTQSLNDLANTQINQNNADNVRNDLLQLTKQSSSYSDVDIKLTVDVVEELLTEGSVYSDNTKGEELVEAMSNILNSPEESIAQSESSHKSSERFVKALDNMANSITPPNGEFSAVNENLALLVRQTDPNNFNGFTMQMQANPGGALSRNQISLKDGEAPSSMVSGVVVPATLFETAGKASPRVSFAVYGNNKMFKSASTASLASQPLVVPLDVTINNINGPVLATSVQNTNVEGLQKPVLFRFKHLNKNSERPQCVSLETTADMAWTKQGCQVKSHVEGSHTDCECNHMTNFALLMDIYQTGDSISKANLLALTYISYIGCGVSLLGLVFTLLTYFLFRKLRKNNPSKILINLCIALALTNVIFLVGMQEYTLNNEIGCKIVAVSLHYFLLSALSWMLVEAYYMYQALIKVFNTHISYFLLKCCLFGWGSPPYGVNVSQLNAAVVPVIFYDKFIYRTNSLPHIFLVPAHKLVMRKYLNMRIFSDAIELLIKIAGLGMPLIVVVVTLGVNKTNNYGEQAGGICWLSPVPFFAAFLAPVGIILILNFITFFLVLRTIIKSSSNKLAKSDNKNSVSQRLRGAITLVVLLGLTWAFAIFAIDNGGIVFQYLFTIFNSLQGLFIFIFYCLLKTDAQHAWRKKLGCVPAKYKGPTSTKDNTTSNTYTSEIRRESYGKKDFTDISKEIEANYPETKIKEKPHGKRYSSYSESNT